MATRGISSPIRATRTPPARRTFRGPRFAYFDEEGNDKSVFIGSQGAGIWRFELEEQTNNLTLEVAGSCPGTVTVTLTNAPPNTEVGTVAAANTNGFTKGGTICNGTQLEIGEPFQLPPVWIKVDGNGTGSKQTTLPADKCFMESMAITTCETSGAVEVQ